MGTGSHSEPASFAGSDFDFFGDAGPFAASEPSRSSRLRKIVDSLLPWRICR
jgi:hypothetical protein